MGEEGNKVKPRSLAKGGSHLIQNQEEGTDLGNMLRPVGDG